MREQRDLEELLKQEKSTPIDDSETSSDTEKSSIPMGHEDDVSLCTEAELSILERRKLDLAQSKQNMTKLEAVEEAVVVGEGLDASNKSSTSNSKLDDPMKKPIRRNASYDELKRSGKGHLNKSMKKSIRRGTSSDSLKNSATSMKRSIRRESADSLRDSGSMKKSIRRNVTSDSLQGSTKSRRTPTQRSEYSKSELRKSSTNSKRSEPFRSSDSALT